MPTGNDNFSVHLDGFHQAATGQTRPARAAANPAKGLHRHD
jgi:hypothetical protein